MSLFPKVLVMGTKAWMLRTTRDNLVLLRKAWANAGRSVVELDEIIGHFDPHLLELEQSKKATADKPTLNVSS
jgi:hypothetical protein